MLTVGASNVFDAARTRSPNRDTNPVFPIVGGLDNGQVYPRRAAPSGTMAPSGTRRSESILIEPLGLTNSGGKASAFPPVSFLHA